MIDIIKIVGGPGSLPFLGLAFVVGGVASYFWPRTRRLIRFALGAVVLGYVVLALPIVANTIAARLPAPSSENLPAISSVDALVVFDGDNRRGRVKEALKIFAVAAPKEVWILGEDWMLDKLAAVIPRERLRIDKTTATTRDQMAWMTRRERSEPSLRLALIASRLQVPRIVALSRAAQSTSTIVASPIDDEPSTSGWRQFIPSYIALRLSRDAFYEVIALKYYRRQGWIQ